MAQYVPISSQRVALMKSLELVSFIATGTEKLSDFKVSILFRPIVISYDEPVTFIK